MSTVEVAFAAALPAGSPLGEPALRAAVEAALVHGGRPGVGLALTLVDEPTLTAMHAEYLDDPTPTDVITFDLGEEGEGPAGELYVSVDRALEVSQRRGVPFERELVLYVVHGALHLCGYDDHDPLERASMRSAEAEVMARLGFEADEAPHDEPA